MRISTPARSAQHTFPFLPVSESVSLQRIRNGNKNRLFPEDRAVHDWYRFVLSFPPQLVREYLKRFGVAEKSLVLDPFCGTGTTLVEAKKLGIRALGLEAHPMAAFASEVKTDWTPDPAALRRDARSAAATVIRLLSASGDNLLTLPPESAKLLLRGSVSPLPLHKTLLLLAHLKSQPQSAYHRHELLALANGLITDIGNLHFGPEVGVGRVKKDAAVLDIWLRNALTIADDLEQFADRASVRTQVWCHDSRQMPADIADASVDAVITSPPYPNEKDYTRTTRLESVLLGFVTNREDLRRLKEGLIRSNTRNVFKTDEDDRWAEPFTEITEIAREIEARRTALGKTSGFERQYARVTRLYFGGMARHFAELRRVLKPGAHLAYVVGDQASYLRVMIRTGQLLRRVAESLGYTVEALDLFRTRLSTATRQQLREEVLVLRWPGQPGRPSKRKGE